MKFDEMTKGEIKKFIRSKKFEAEELRDKIAMTNDANEVRSLGETLKKLRDEINEAENALDDQDDSDDQGDGGNGSEGDNGMRSLDPMKTMRMGSYQQRTGFSSGVIVPDSLSLRSDEKLASRYVNAEKLDLGKYIRGMVSGDWSDAENERRAMTTSGTGVLIPQVLSAEIIDTARNLSLFTASGVPVYPMPEGNLTIARVAKDPVFSFKAEGAEQATGNDFELDSVTLKARTAYGYCYVSREAILSAKNLNDVIHRAFAGAMADCIDKAMLYGQYNSVSMTYDDFAPSGIMNDENINVVVAQNDERFADFIRGIGAVRRANGTPTVLGINAETEEFLSIYTNSVGDPVEPPKAVQKLTTVVSNQLKSDAETGNDALVFDPNAMVIGMQNLITVKMIEQSDYCIKNNMIGFQVFCMIDEAVVRPTHISKITGIKDTLTEKTV